MKPKHTPDSEEPQLNARTGRLDDDGLDHAGLTADPDLTN